MNYASNTDFTFKVVAKQMMNMWQKLCKIVYCFEHWYQHTTTKLVHKFRHFQQTNHQTNRNSIFTNIKIIIYLNLDIKATL